MAEFKGHCGGLPIICAMVAALLPAAAHANQSFLDAKASKAAYTVAEKKPARSCRSFLANTTIAYSIVSAREIAASKTEPAYCVLQGIITPEVQFWVYLPAAWNGRFYMPGNGGYAGNTPEENAGGRGMTDIRRALASGFAVAISNTGHDATFEPLGSFGFNNVQKSVDFGYRAVHLTAVTAKDLVSDYYGERPFKSYWAGCSMGGRQGMMSAQRFPDDFDGIVADDPVNAFTDLHISLAWFYRALADGPVQFDKVTRLLAPRVLARCDELDGLKDGLVSAPDSCRFAPAQKLPVCGAEEARDCFTKSEIATLEKLYGGVVSNGKAYHPGLPVGSEAGWFGWWPKSLGGYGAFTIEDFANTFLQYFAFRKDDPARNYRSFNFDSDLAKLDPSVKDILDATDPDLSAFRSRGGKMVLMIPGSGSSAIPTKPMTDYYHQVAERFGPAQTRDFFRVMTVPGMYHCFGGNGPSQYDAMTAVIDWVEKGVQPDNLIASQIEGSDPARPNNGGAPGKVLRTLPVCTYPEIPRYRGKGDPSLAASFSCQ